MSLIHYLCTCTLQSDDKDAEARSLVKDVMNLQKLRGADGDLDAKDPLQENLGRRKTIQNLNHQGDKRKSVRTLKGAFERRITRLTDEPGW